MNTHVRLMLLSSLILATSLMRLGAYPKPVIVFSGYEWFVKYSDYPIGPGPNLWSSENVWIDFQGRLHLRIKRINGVWYCSEVYTVKVLGHGAYIYVLDGSYDLLDEDVVLGLFAYEDNFHEVDIEIARWGNSKEDNLWYTIQPYPYTMGVNQMSYRMGRGFLAIHVIIWARFSVQFRSFIIKSWSYGYVVELHQWNSTRAVSADGARAHINLWLLRGGSIEHDVEIVVRMFKFIPLEELNLSAIDELVYDILRTYMPNSCLYNYSF